MEFKYIINSYVRKVLNLNVTAEIKFEFALLTWYE